MSVSPRAVRSPLLVIGVVLAVLAALIGPVNASPAPPPPPTDSVRVLAGNVSGAPEENFEKIKLTDDVGEPMALAVAPDGRVLMTDRRGVVRLFDPVTYNVTEAGRIPVYTGEEDGLQGIALDPNFAQNGWVYTYYSPAGPEPKNRLSRFQLDGAQLNLAEEQVILEVPTQRDLCCHVGGDIDFDSKGNLLLSTGDNTNSWASDGYSPIDERPGRAPFDAQKSSANTNDLRGKLLRITVQPDGSYTIPEGNLFPPGTPSTRPEIYFMGLRNPFRFSVDRATDWVYVGVVGPDASEDDPERGPRQYDELDLVKGPGNGGWPYCIADNIPYRDYDFATGVSGPPFDCANLTNDSPNNTGLTELPPAQTPLIWYPYECFDVFPQIDCPGGGTAMGGPVYRFDPDLASPTKFPAEYDGAAFFYEYSRGFVKDVRGDGQGQLVSISPFMPNADFDQPMDMEFGPEGSLYVLEYGGGFFTPGPNAGLYRIDHTNGQRSPTAQVTATPRSGNAPLEVSFDASESSDPDGDELRFQWDLDGDGTIDTEGPQVQHTYAENAAYDAKLILTDATGRVTVARVPISVGNHEPVVNLELPPDGSMIDFGDEISYRVGVSDTEDGVIGQGISCADVRVQVALGHDEHAHPQTEVQGCSGRIQIQQDDGHGSDANLFIVLRATYTDRGGPNVPPAEGSHEIRLQPKNKQAEHATALHGASVVSDDGAQGDAAIGDIDPGDAVSWRPMSLESVQSAAFRVAAPGAGGTIELRAGAPDGPLVATAPVPGGVPGYVDLPAVPVVDPGGSHELFAVFGGQGSDLFRLDAMRFTGLGAAGPLNVSAASDLARGPAPLEVTLSATADSAPAGSQYQWDFGDGTTGVGARVGHTYTELGEYTATVTVVDPQGFERGSASTVVTATEPVRGALAVSPGSAELDAGQPHEVTATLSGPNRAGAPITFEVYRRAPAAGLPPGHSAGVPFMLADRQVVNTDQGGLARLSYSSPVAASEVVLACAALQDSCSRGDGRLVVVDGVPVNVRDDVPTGRGQVLWHPAPDAEGWLRLFDGSTLAGFSHVGQGGFTVADGMLQPTASGRGVLWYSQQQFGDFVLEAEYETFNVSADSGLMLRFGDPGGDATLPGREGYEVAILDRVESVDQRTGSLRGVKAAEFLAAKPPLGGWNRFSIEVRGNTYVVRLNDQVVTEYTGDASRGQGPFIGLENADNQLRFRDIRVRPL
ncbi:PQQ-dependent sugar dehydrogenase [Saccharopolyspora sp. K220]|uniref:PQQ-dependent sugar dehydrogenase n=1 Tax=Saccharopolyspora soli TaxID=2926618 RepID=UPI001F5AB4E5|nr:PQQ-dependent sugar dehydrogenase [Saccharopolyspora soli]MCI2420240.1 PQQ-dependent sugar dehydrogenase [Saccharopolyspora soli]